MNIEDKIIKTFSSQNKYIGDDCAYIKETNQLITTDIIVENTHFDLKNFTETQIAHRLFVSNYSDMFGLTGNELNLINSQVDIDNEKNTDKKVFVPQRVFVNI